MSGDRPQQYLRRCNGQPAAGIPVSGRGLDIILAGSKDVRRADDGRISWTSSGRKFTAEPAPGACSAPGAGASADESMAATP